MTISICLPEHRLADIVCETDADNAVLLFCDIDSDLAEGPLWHPRRNSLLWVDILKDRLYEKVWGTGYVSYWQLPSTASSIALDSEDEQLLWLITADAIAAFDMANSKYHIKAPLSFPSEYRTNDGAVSPDGRYWFGIMLRQPQAGSGDVYSIGRKADLQLEIQNVAIPNTFIWQDDGKLLLITDSMQQLVRQFDTSLSEQDFSTGRAWFDLSSTDQTPDGAATDNLNNIWIAIWGGQKLICMDRAGNILNEIGMPVLQPSSCCFGGPDNNLLFVTTAKQGLSDEQLVEFADSGKIFVIKTAMQGAPVHAFRMD